MNPVNPSPTPPLSPQTPPSSPQSCPLCNHQAYTTVYPELPTFREASIVQCSQCGHYYTLLKTGIDTDALYEDEVYKVVDNRDSIYDKILSREYNGVLHQLARLLHSPGFPGQPTPSGASSSTAVETSRTPLPASTLPASQPPPSLLDFGSGKGKFASLAQRQGWKVKGVETSPSRAAFAKAAYGLDIYTGFYTTGALFNTRFDALTLFHVLEHLPHPQPLLDELIRHNLAKNGLVVIEVPNFSSSQARIAGANWIHLDVPRHINHFTPQRLETFLQSLGLKPVKKSYFSMHLGVLGMVDSLLKRLGYRNNIIFELKNKKSKSLILAIAALLPLAYCMERIAAALGKGGIVRLYLDARAATEEFPQSSDPRHTTAGASTQKPTT